MSYNLDVYTPVSYVVQHLCFNDLKPMDIQNHVLDLMIEVKEYEDVKSCRKVHHILELAMHYGCDKVKEMHWYGPDYIYMNLVFESQDKTLECKNKLIEIFGINIKFDSDWDILKKSIYFFHLWVVFLLIITKILQRYYNYETFKTNMKFYDMIKLINYIMITYGGRKYVW